MRGHRFITPVAASIALAGLVIATGSCNDPSTASPVSPNAAKSTSATGVPRGARQVQHATLNGDGASLQAARYTYDGVQLIEVESFTVTVSRTNRDSVWLEYGLSATGIHLEYDYGYGSIASSALRGDGASHLSLHIDLANAGPNFVRGFDGGGSLSAVPRLDIEWRKVGDQYTMTNGVTRTVTPWGGSQTEGNSREGTALVTMTAPLQNAYWTDGLSGTLSKSHQSVTSWSIVQSP